MNALILQLILGPEKKERKKCFFFFVNSESCRVSQVAASVDS